MMTNIGFCIGVAIPPIIYLIVFQIVSNIFEIPQDWRLILGLTALVCLAIVVACLAYGFVYFMNRISY